MTNPFLHYVDDFEKEAEAFLTKYKCADAIDTPRCIPIYDIATRLMSLDVIQTECLSPDDSVQGAIVFSKGIIDVYDWTTKEYMGYEAQRPSIFVDSDILNVGRINNTLAHECFHWWRHRNYFNYKRVQEQSAEFGIRCEKNAPRKDADSGQWTDVERMEWQARTIAPKILMPRKATRKKIEELYQEEGSSPAATGKVVDRLAEFFKVSRQSAAIRMTELGFDKAAEYTAPENVNGNARQTKIRKSSNAARRNQTITPLAAFELYKTNEFLRATIDTGAFCYVDGYFAIRDGKYVLDDGGTFKMTEYAQSHLPECTLDFSTKLVGEAYLVHDASAHMMYRSDVEFKEKSSFDANTQNTELFNKAKDFEAKFKRSRSAHKTATEQLWEYIQEAHWNSAIFVSRTGLDAMHFTRVQKPDHKFTLRPLVAMGVGLQLDLNEMEEVLSLAGLSFNPTSLEDQAYKYLFTGMYGKTVDECNEFLEKIGVPILGTQQRV